MKRRAFLASVAAGVGVAVTGGLAALSSTKRPFSRFTVEDPGIPHRPIPRNTADTVTWRRPVPRPANLDSLQRGVAPGRFAVDYADVKAPDLDLAMKNLNRYLS